MEQVKRLANTIGEGFISASPERLGRVEELFGEVWAMRPTGADTGSALHDRYVSFGLAGVGQWGMAYGWREGEQRSASVPIVTAQIPSVVSLELYALADGTVWQQKGEGAVPINAGAQGVKRMMSILETIRVGILTDPRDCMVDGRPLASFSLPAR